MRPVDVFPSISKRCLQWREPCSKRTRFSAEDVSYGSVMWIRHSCRCYKVFCQHRRHLRPSLDIYKISGERKDRPLARKILSDVSRNRDLFRYGLIWMWGYFATKFMHDIVMKSEPDFCRLYHLLQFLLFELLPENSLFVKILPLLLL